MSSKLMSFLLASVLMTIFTVSAHAKTYQVGSTTTGVPFTFLNAKTNTVQGVMVDLINAIAKNQNFKVEIKAMPFNTLIPSLSTGKIQIISAALGITKVRESVVDFTTPVYSYGEGFVVNQKDTTDYKSYDNLKGKVIGVQVGTVYVEPMKNLGIFKEVRVYDSLADVIRDVALGRIKAGFGDYPILAYQLSHGGNQGVRLVKGVPTVVNVKIGMAVRKGDKATLEKLNNGLAQLKSNGTLDKVLVKWGLK
jgi:polar amino acid transport system substrate-binding protein